MAVSLCFLLFVCPWPRPQGSHTWWLSCFIRVWESESAHVALQPQLFFYQTLFLYAFIHFLCRTRSVVDSSFLAQSHETGQNPELVFKIASWSELGEDTCPGWFHADGTQQSTGHLPAYYSSELSNPALPVGPRGRERQQSRVSEGRKRERVFFLWEHPVIILPQAPSREKWVFCVYGT